MTSRGYTVTAEKTRWGGIMDEGADEFYQLKTDDSPQQALKTINTAMMRAGFAGAPPPPIIPFTRYKQDDITYRNNSLEDVGLSLPIPAPSSYICTYQSMATMAVSKSYTQIEIFPSNGQTTIEVTNVNIVLS